MRLWVGALVVAVVAACVVSAVWASVSFTPPGGKAMYVGSMALQPTDQAGRATATVTMVCGTDLGKGMMTIQATGLDPKGMYEAYLVKPAKAKGQEQRTGVGKAPYRLTVNAKGFGNLMADLPNCKAAVMQKLEVVRPPAKGSKAPAAVVFTADLGKLLEGKKAG